MKKKNNPQQSIRQLMGITEITEYSLKTASSETVFFSIKPCNISILSEESLSGKIYSLMSVLKGVSEIEFLCLNSRESFESNKNFLRSRIAKEENPTVRSLLEQDIQYLDHIQAQTATAREFLLVVRIRGLKDKEIFSHLNRIEKILTENGFTVRRYAREDIKTLLAVYYEQNVTTELFENIDGERWLIHERKTHN
jgi:hypothetical protein